MVDRDHHWDCLDSRGGEDEPDVQLQEHVIRRANRGREKGDLGERTSHPRVRWLVGQDARYGAARGRAEELTRGDRRPKSLQPTTEAI